MKRNVVCVLAGMLLAAAVFAEESANYVVQSVIGNVTYEKSAGVWEAVTNGMELAAAANVNTGLNSTLIVKSGKQTATIKPMQKGTLSSLCSKAVAKTGITIGSKITTTDVSASATGSRANVSTASSRASDADKDLNWEE